MKLRGKYTIVFLLLAVIPIARVSWISYINAEGQLKDSIRNQARIAAEEYSLGIGNWLEGKENSLLMMARLLQDAAQAENIQKILPAYTSDPDISDMYFAYEHNDVFLDGSGWLPPLSFHPHQRPWYQAASARNGPAFSGPYIDAITGHYIYSISVAIRDKNGNLTGVLGEDISLDTLTRRAASMQLDRHGYGFIIDRSGLIIAHPDKNLVGKNGNDLKEFSQPVKDFFAGREGSASYRLNGERYFLSWQQVPMTNWIFGLAIEEDVLFKPLESMRSRFVVIAIWMMAMAVLLSMLYAKKLTSPIARLMVSAEQIAGGDMTVRTEMKGKDEIANFSRVFNQMTESLNEMIRGINTLAAEVDESAKTVAVFCDEAEQMVVQLNASISNSAREAGQQAASVQKAREILEGIIHNLGQTSPELEEAAAIPAEEKSAAEMGFPGIQAQAMLLGYHKKTLESITHDSGRINLLLSGMQLADGQDGNGWSVAEKDTLNKLAFLSDRIMTALEQAGSTVAQQESGIIELLEAYSLLLEHVQKTQAFTEEAMNDYRELKERAGIGMETLNEIALVVMNNAVEAEDLATSTQQQAASISEISAHAARLSQNAQKMFEAVQRFKV